MWCFKPLKRIEELAESFHEPSVPVKTKSMVSKIKQPVSFKHINVYLVSLKQYCLDQLSWSISLMEGIRDQAVNLLIQLRCSCIRNVLSICTKCLYQFHVILTAVLPLCIACIILFRHLSFSEKMRNKNLSLLYLK